MIGPKKELLCLCVITLFSSQAGAQTWADWDELSGGSANITGSLGSLGITVTNTSDTRNPLIINNLGEVDHIGDSGMRWDPDGAAEGLDFSETNGSYQFVFSTALTEELFFVWTAGDQGLSFSEGALTRTVAGIGSGSNTFVFFDSPEVEEAGGTLRLGAGVSAFSITTNGGLADVWHGSFVSATSVPEPASSLLLVMGSCSLLLRKSRRGKL